MALCEDSFGISALLCLQQGLNQLSCAIHLSDEKVDSALRRTDEVHRQTGRRREKEIQDLRQVIVAKEHGIDSLRETLSCTKRSLESRVRDLEEALRDRDSQVGMLTHSHRERHAFLDRWFAELPFAQTQQF